MKSRQVNLDPEPWVTFADEGGITGRYGAPRIAKHWCMGGESVEHSPRPEFEPTRDPQPFAGPKHGVRWGSRDLPRGRAYIAADHDDPSDVVFRMVEKFKWAPRREQFDTPVNSILQNFRAALGHYEVAGEEADSAQQAELWLADWRNVEGTPAERDHARRVLTRLAGLTKEN